MQGKYTSFPHRKWEQNLNGKWSSHEPTKEDLKQRRELLLKYGHPVQIDAQTKKGK